MFIKLALLVLVACVPSYLSFNSLSRNTAGTIYSASSVARSMSSGNNIPDFSKEPVEPPFR
jgi:hypothetical protein